MATRVVETLKAFLDALVDSNSSVHIENVTVRVNNAVTVEGGGSDAPKAATATTAAKRKRSDDGAQPAKRAPPKKQPIKVDSRLCNLLGVSAEDSYEVDALAARLRTYIAENNLLVVRNGKADKRFFTPDDALIAIWGKEFWDASRCKPTEKQPQALNMTLSLPHAISKLAK